MDEGYQLGRYQIKEEIGRGGFAAVFRAEDTVLGREVAVKIMRPLLMSEAGFVARFTREAQVAAQLEHPHIIPVYDYGEANSRIYLVMKLVAYGSVEKWLKEQGSFTLAQALVLMRQITAALAYAHRQQVIHRDIKPDNILLGRNNHAYLADFGLVKALQQTSSLTASLSGGIVGTYAYIPPEIWSGQKASPATDIYSLAAVLAEMLTGQKLFPGETPMAVMRQHDQGPQLPQHWPAGISPTINHVLQKALAAEPAMRYQTATAFLHALELCQVQPAVSPIPNRPVPQQRDQIPSQPASQPSLPQELPSNNQTKGKWWGWAVGGAGLILISVFVYIAIASWGLAESGGRSLSMPSATTGGSFEAEATPTAHPTATPALETNLGIATAPDLPTATSTSSPSSTPTNVPTISAGTIREVTLPQGGIVEMAHIPAGTFTMGSDLDNVLTYEKPSHEVTINAYWLDRTPVTNAQFAAFVLATNYITTSDLSGGFVWQQTEAEWRRNEAADWRQPRGIGSDIENDNLANHPVVQVSWHDAVAFCEWRDARLPTEAEWEKAVRGSDGRLYPWGNEFIGTNLNYCDRNCPHDTRRDEATDDGYRFTSPVGSYPAGATPYGILDMAGNVWEWTDSWFTAYPGNTEEDRAYGQIYKSLRGGSWLNEAVIVRATNRHKDLPTARFSNVGFRCAQDGDS